MSLDRSYDPDDAPEVAKKKPSGHGGWRPGAGRKPTLDDPVSFTGEIERADMVVLEAISEERGVSIASLALASKITTRAAASPSTLLMPTSYIARPKTAHPQQAESFGR